jgi:hypothetical protein
MEPKKEDSDTKAETGSDEVKISLNLPPLSKMSAPLATEIAAESVVSTSAKRKREGLVQEIL